MIEIKKKKPKQCSHEAYGVCCDHFMDGETEA